MRNVALPMQPSRPDLPVVRLTSFGQKTLIQTAPALPSLFTFVSAAPGSEVTLGEPLSARTYCAKQSFWLRCFVGSRKSTVRPGDVARSPVAVGFPFASFVRGATLPATWSVPGA